LFLLNVLLVIIGYATRGAVFQFVKVSRTALLVLSLAGLFTATQGYHRYLFRGNKSWVLWLFILINLLVMSFSINFFKSITRVAAWLPFLIYINYFIVYLHRRYEKHQVKIKLIQLFALAYLLPLIVLFLLSNPLLNRDIYGLTIGGFKANVLGWSGAAFFAMAVDLLTHVKPKGWQKGILVFAMVMAIITLITSGSRSGYLCVAVSLSILVLTNGKINFFLKVLVTLFIMATTYYMLADPDSTVNQRIHRSEQQLEKGEYRFQLAKTAFAIMYENPHLLLTGFGYDNALEGIAHYSGISFDLPSHNSYLELFITTGFISFLFFLIFLVLNALFRYVLFDSRQFVFLPTFMIIPFFESNLNAGQFLFFPWMTFLFYYVHAGSRQYPIPVRKSGDVPIGHTAAAQPFFAPPRQ
jgi:O-antigen ligase